MFRVQFLGYRYVISYNLLISISIYYNYRINETIKLLNDAISSCRITVNHLVSFQNRV